MQRSCGHCGRAYEAKRSTSVYCSSSCRGKATHARAAAGAAPVGAASSPAVVAGVPAPRPRDSAEGLAAACEKALRDAGRLTTWQGRSAAELARRIEQGSLMDTGSAYAALHRELHKAMAEALKGADAVKSAAQSRRDELADRRGASATQSA